MKTKKISIKKYISLVLAVLLAALLLAGFTFKQTAEEITTNEPVTKEEAATGNTSTDAKHSNESGKEETVYVVADAYGKPTDITSSIRLKNKNGSATLIDESSLKDIESIKGDVTFEQDGTDIIWQANGSDVYYQGQTDKDLPLSVDISYELDGKKIDAENLAGASGHLKVNFTYKNDTAEKRIVNGKEVILYQPFTVMSGLMLDGDKASNVTVSNGKAAVTADNSLVMGIAMPGLKESLGINEMKDADGSTIDMDIPENVVIEADVEDFELITTITIVDNSMLNDLDLDNIKSVDDMQKAIRDLKDASSELSKGTEGLYNGVDSLNSGSNELSKGSEELDKGAQELKDGADGFKNGTNELKKGTDALAGGAAGLYNGALQLNSALKGKEGKSIYEGVEAIEKGAKDISSGLKSNNKNKPGVYEAAEGIKDGAKEISEGADEIADGAETIKKEISGQMDKLSGQIESLRKLGMINDTMYVGVQAMISEYTSKMDELYAALDQIKDGAEAISDGAKSDDPKNPGIYEAAGGIGSGADELKKGADEIAKGAGSLESGIEEITNDANLGALIAGLKELESGADALGDGAKQVDDGAASLAEGIAALKEGALALSDGSKELSDGTKQLLDGAKALKDGMTAYDEEGIKKLSDISEGDLTNFIERLKALQQLGKEYISFSGIKDGEAGQLQFIIRTESIEK